MSIKAGSQFEGNGASPSQNKAEIKLKENAEAVKTGELRLRAVFRAAVFLNFSSQIRQNKRESLNSSYQTAYAKFVYPLHLAGGDSGNSAFLARLNLNLFHFLIIRGVSIGTCAKTGAG
jgi:hypothetical protein